MTDWTSYGRIDADGTVYVKTADGERVVGSWQAGTPEEGLAHFARRFADLVTEVDVLEARLLSGAADPTQAAASVRRLRDSLAEASVVGDLDGLAARLDKLATVADDRAVVAKAAREALRAEALARKTALVQEAEQIAAESTSWKAAGDRLRDIFEEWRTIRGIDRKTDTELWKRYAAARDAFSRRRGAHFASLDAGRKQAQAAKEEMVAQAEALDVEADPRAAQAALRSIQARWHETGRVRREAAAPLERRLRAVEEKVAQAMDTAWRRTDPSENPLLIQMREQVATAEARLERAKAAGDPKRIAEAEQALASKRQFLQLAERSGG